MYPTGSDTATQHVDWIVPDVQGGAYVGWSATGFVSGPPRSGNHQVVSETLGTWIQHLDAQGVKLWGPRGRRIVTVDSLNDGAAENIIFGYTDGSGGFVAVEPIFVEGGTALKLHHYEPSQDTVTEYIHPSPSGYSLIPNYTNMGDTLIQFYRQTNGDSLAILGFDGQGAELLRLFLPVVARTHDIHRVDGQGNFFIRDTARILHKFAWSGDEQWTYLLPESAGIIPTGTGGVISAWVVDSTGGNLYNQGWAQKIDRNGALAWGPILFTRSRIAPPSYLYFDILSDSRGGAIVYWLSPSYTLYGQLIGADGVLGTSPNAIEPTPQTRQLVQVSDPYPNPFNWTFTLQYRVPNPGRLVIKVFDTRGALVSQYEQRVLQGGTGRITIEMERSLPSGVYLLQVITEHGRHQHKTVKRIVYLK